MQAAEGAGSAISKLPIVWRNNHKERVKMKRRNLISALGLLAVLSACGGAKAASLPTTTDPSSPESLAAQLCQIMKDGIDLGLDSNMRSVVAVLNIAKERPFAMELVEKRCPKELQQTEVFEALDSQTSH
jgi:hypothetical protein